MTDKFDKDRFIHKDLSTYKTILNFKSSFKKRWGK